MPTVAKQTREKAPRQAPPAVETREQALQGIEHAPWDLEQLELVPLKGFEIWGRLGRFAEQRVGTEFTFERARAEVERYKWS